PDQVDPVRSPFSIFRLEQFPRSAIQGAPISTTVVDELLNLARRPSHPKSGRSPDFVEHPVGKLNVGGPGLTVGWPPGARYGGTHECEPANRMTEATDTLRAVHACPPESLPRRRDMLRDLLRGQRPVV